MIVFQIVLTFIQWWDAKWAGSAVFVRWFLWLSWTFSHHNNGRGTETGEKVNSMCNSELKIQYVLLFNTAKSTWTCSSSFPQMSQGSCVVVNREAGDSPKCTWGNWLRVWVFDPCLWGWLVRSSPCSYLSPEEFLECHQSFAVLCWCVYSFCGVSILKIKPKVLFRIIINNCP